MSFRKTFFLFFIFCTINGYSQQITRNKLLCDSLSKLSSKIWKLKNDTSKITASEEFFVALKMVLNSDTYFDHSFDSIYGISRAVSDDDKLRIFTWNIPLSDGSNKYYGIIQLKGDKRTIIPLRSLNSVQPISEHQLIKEADWYGALYYKIIRHNNGKGDFYTLLGWDGFNTITNRKVIDILTIDTDGKIVFGQPVFKTSKGIKSRIIFEFAENANMLLRYDYQAIRIKKGKKIRNENTWLIVMDRLIPIDPTLAGISKYYVPAGDVYDGYMYTNGFWVLVEDIEVANK